MANLKVENLAKSYDGETNILEDISFNVSDGEFVSILGPSGCGKTTTLRIIAGLLEQTSGRVFVDGEDINRIPVYKRSFGMVFQSYALFPHMTVFDNIAFGLKMRKISSSEIKKRVSKILKITGLNNLIDRFPAELSGGQQQRVSLARALVIQPRILLMDEPLSNLDAKLRVQMREEIRNLQQQFKITVLFVTHDQEECFAISDKVLVMKNGKIEQFDTPQQIYHYPATKYVAQFIGYENFIEVDQVLADNCFKTKNFKFTTFEKNDKANFLTIRPDNVLLLSTDQNENKNVLVGKIVSTEYLGKNYRYQVATDLGMFKVDETSKFKRSLGEKVLLSFPIKYLLPLKN
ncbi:MAG: ABC transporter ATP-binding protein [Liquorilactobacillus ghanensis]|uniref:ABC transporter ATP-binding protein n=1 Tax=Liquorilactobacillus ghanensis TaxID=399370 RepID=UPI0039EA2604